MILLMNNLRRWQKSALADYAEKQQRIYTVQATPGGGKTRLGLAIAQSLLNSAEIKQLVVLCHTTQIRYQWILAAQQVGLCIVPSIPRLDFEEFDGYVLSYQQITDDSYAQKANSQLRGRKRSLVILDEPHHLADAQAWGNGVKTALKYAHRILLLSGTLFRHDEGAIPFVKYKDGVLVPDFEYGYSAALKDNVVAPVYFPTYGGETDWQVGEDSARAKFGDDISDRDLSRQLNTAISSEGWLRTVFKSASAKLEETRQTDPSAAGLIVAKSIPHAKLIAEVMTEIAGETPAIALSDNSKADQVISDFAEGSGKWLVAVRMVSEGVDIPRLRVGVYATNILTELFFRQVIGRLVRIDEAHRNHDAHLFIPRHPALLKYAEGIASERYHTFLEEKVAGAERSSPEVFGLLEPVGAIARAGETLAPVSAPASLGLLEQGFLLLDEAQQKISAARKIFTQLAAATPENASSHIVQGSLSNAAQKILSLLAIHKNVAIGKQQLEILSELTRSVFYNEIASLFDQQMIVLHTDDAVTMTDTGLSQLDLSEIKPTRGVGDIVALWSDVLSSRQVNLLNALVDRYPERLNRKELAIAAGYAAGTARSIGKDLSRLEQCRLCNDSDGGIKLNASLMNIPFEGY